MFHAPDHTSAGKLLSWKNWTCKMDFPSIDCFAMNVQQIIHACGGATKVADASRRTGSPVTFEAVFKWYRNGIPEAHWPLVIGLSGLTVQASRFAPTSPPAWPWPGCRTPSPG